jgi:hypothetical protein
LFFNFQPQKQLTFFLLLPPCPPKGGLIWKHELNLLIDRTFEKNEEQKNNEVRTSNDLTIKDTDTSDK